MPKLPKPEPVSHDLRCSICDLSWADHGDEPNVMICVELLRAELESSRGGMQWNYTTPMYAGGLVPSVSDTTTAPHTYTCTDPAVIEENLCHA